MDSVTLKVSVGSITQTHNTQHITHFRVGKFSDPKTANSLYINYLNDTVLR